MTEAPTQTPPHDATRRTETVRPHQARQESGLLAPGDPEREFMEAMQQYKAISGRMFPNWSEVLEVLQSLDYQKP